MLQAKNSKGKLITLASLPKSQIDKIRKRETFICPQCASPLIVRAGPRVIPHFAHRSTASCQLSSTGESAYHQKAKLLLYQWLQRQNIPANLEVYLPKIKQRPDILFTYGNKVFSMEFQYTQADLMTIRRRNEGYQQLNIIPIWILGSSFLKRTAKHRLQINDFILQFVHQFSLQLPTTLYFFSPEQRVFSIVNDLHLINRRSTYAAISYENLAKFTFRDLFLANQLSVQQLFTSWKKEKRNFRLSPKRVYGQELKWRKWLYNQQLHLEQLPSVIHLPTSTQLFYKVPPWHWQSRFIIEFLHPLRNGQPFSKQQINQFFWTYLYSSDEFPLLAPSEPPMSYINLLIQLHYVKKINPTTFIKTRDFQFYDHIESAIVGDDELLTAIMYN